MKAFRSAVTLIAAITAAALVLVGCGNSSSGDDGPLEMRIAMPVYPILPSTVPITIAMENGYFADEGIEIKEVLSPEGGGSTARNLLAGKLEMALVSFSSAIQAQMAGAPLVAVGVGQQEVPEFGWVAAEDSPIDSLDDAIESGAKIGYSSPGAATEALLALGLEKRGVDPTKANIGSTGGAGPGLSFVRSGQDFELASIVEPLLAMNPDGLKLVYDPYEDGIQKYLQSVWTTTPSFVKDHPETIEGFNRAWNRAIDDISADVDAAAKVWAEAADLPEEVTLETLTQINDKSGFENYFGRGFSVEPITSVLDSMEATGELPEDAVIPWDEFISQDFLGDGVEELDLSTLPHSAE